MVSSLALGEMTTFCAVELGVAAFFVARCVMVVNG